jgi:hypothetical protein
LVASVAVSLSLIASSTAAVASTAPPQSPAGNAWLALSMWAPSGAALLGETSVATAQPETPPPPPEAPPPPPPPEGGGIGTPPIPVLVIWLAVLGVDVWLLTKNNHHHAIPNSPA